MVNMSIINFRDLHAKEEKFETSHEIKLTWLPKNMRQKNFPGKIEKSNGFIIIWIGFAVK